MSNKQNEVWNISGAQLESMNVASRFSNFLIILPDSNDLVAANAIDSGFTALFIDKNFGKSVSNKAIIHNLPNVLKVIKSIGSDSSTLKISGNSFVISDSDSKIRCNYQFASEGMIKVLLDIIESKKYNKLIEKITSDVNSISFNFTKSMFTSIKNFMDNTFNTVCFTGSKIVIYDNVGSTDFNEKANVEIDIDTTIDTRFDIDMKLFSLITPDDYTCVISKSGQVLFYNSSGKNYLIATNILEQ